LQFEGLVAESSKPALKGEKTVVLIPYVPVQEPAAAVLSHEIEISFEHHLFQRREVYNDLVKTALELGCFVNGPRFGLSRL